MEIIGQKTGNSKSEYDKTSKEVAFNSFPHFFFYHFSVGVNRVDGFDFTPDHLKDYCLRLQYNKRTATKAPRFHLKSTVTEGFIAWKLWRMERVWNEWDYMSYTEELGEYHTKRLKRYISNMPEIYEGFQSLSSSESIIYYRLADRRFYCTPAGVISFKRGRHPTGMICDDVLKDPSVKLDTSQLEKIARAYHEEVENMPREDLHLVGTPQDQEDLFYQVEQDPKYNCRTYTAEKDPTKKIALWEKNPRYNWESLMQMKAKSIKTYMKEMLCMPVRATEAFISLDQYNAMVNSRLKNHDIIRKFKMKENRTVLGGFDIGKKTHPSHLAVFAVVRALVADKIDGVIVLSWKDVLVQIHSKFMDGWDYIDQIDYLKKAINHFKIDKLFYDNTRAEFESHAEAGSLPAEMEGISFTVKEKNTLATEMDIAITQHLLQLVVDDRQKKQILSVDCDLNAPQTKEGHGDAFMSVALAVKAWREASAILCS